MKNNHTKDQYIKNDHIMPENMVPAGHYISRASKKRGQVRSIWYVGVGVLSGFRTN